MKQIDLVSVRINDFNTEVEMLINACNIDENNFINWIIENKSLTISKEDVIEFLKTLTIDNSKSTKLQAEVSSAKVVNVIVDDNLSN